jgi:hypothetical protein
VSFIYSLTHSSLHSIFDLLRLALQLLLLKLRSIAIRELAILSSNSCRTILLHLFDIC